MHTSSKEEAKKFAMAAMARKPDAVSIDNILYLDEDLHTYKYFLTGNFDEEARKKEIQAQQAEAQKGLNNNDNSSQNSMDEIGGGEEPPPAGSFMQKL